jgi:AraC family cel operon transcriptional repressor
MVRLPALGTVMDLARWRYHRGEGWQPHCHDFYEIFWIEHGYCRHIRDTEECLLGPGDLYWLHPDDLHVGSADDDAGVIFINLSVSRQAVAELRLRHGETFRLWDMRQPRRQRLAAPALRELAGLVAEADTASTADRDLLLLRLSSALRDSVRGFDLAVMPPWLRSGIQDVDADLAWGEGVAGLSRRCQRSREHCNRTVRAVLGVTATQLLQSVRMQVAAKLLVMDDVPIVEVATSTGFTSLAHFYKLFRATYGETPRTYRQRRRSQGPAGAEPRTVHTHG